MDAECDGGHLPLVMYLERDTHVSEGESIRCGVKFILRNFVLLVRFALLQGGEQTLPLQSVQFFACHLNYSRGAI
jgi:hypothetical protein